MDRENLETARRLWKEMSDGAAAGQVTAEVSAEWHPEIEYIEDPNWPGAGVYRGPEAIRRRFAEYLEVFGPTEMTLEQLVEAGDDVVSLFLTRGESSQSGLPFEHEWAYVWSFRDGRVVTWRAFFERSEAMAAVGLQD
jgi:ketosteroid isomerase-like protein